MENKRTKILVVDDESEVLDTLKHFLSVKGYEVMGAYSGKEALRILENKKVDLILLDIMMPGMRGTTIAKIIKDRYPDIKIMVVTAYPEEGRKVSQDIVLEGLFIKPLGTQELYNRLLNITKDSYASNHQPL